MPREGDTSARYGLQPGAPLSLPQGLCAMVYMVAVLDQLCSSDDSPIPQTRPTQVPEEFSPPEPGSRRWGQEAKQNQAPEAGDSWEELL